MFVSLVNNLKKINLFSIISSDKALLKCDINKTFSLKHYSQQTEVSNGIVNLQIERVKLKYPSIWLRDNCQCDQCFHRSAQSRTIDWRNINTDVKPKEIQENKDAVEILWNDGHMSKYDYKWLKFRSFLPEHQKEYEQKFYKPVKVTWKNDTFSDVFKKHDYETLLLSEKSLYNWIHDLAVYGVALIVNTPNTERAVDALIKKIGFPKKTHYGEKFIVQHVTNTSNVAYLSSDLQMHTDLPYYEYVPGVNVLHCLVQTLSEGGENLLSDSHYVADYMKRNHFKEYKLLTEVDVEWSDIGTEHGTEFYKLHRAPVLCVNKKEQIIRVNFSVPQRGNYFPCDIDVVKPWYEAQQLFYRLSNDFAAKFKTRAGEMLVFDNTRLLHGRNGYVDSSNNVRKIIGVYLDWDEIYSKFRCLKIKLDEK